MIETIPLEHAKGGAVHHITKLLAANIPGAAWVAGSKV